MIDGLKVKIADLGQKIKQPSKLEDKNRRLRQFNGDLAFVEVN